MYPFDGGESEKGKFRGGSIFGEETLSRIDRSIENEGGRGVW